MIFTFRSEESAVSDLTVRIEAPSLGPLPDNSRTPRHTLTMRFAVRKTVEFVRLCGDDLFPAFAAWSWLLGLDSFRTKIKVIVDKLMQWRRTWQS